MRYLEDLQDILKIYLSFPMYATVVSHELYAMTLERNDEGIVPYM